MAQELQKASSESIETARRLYLESRDRAVMWLLDIMALQYGMDLTPEYTRFWKESLSDLSPNQIREGLRNHMASERGTYKPVPGDIIGKAPEATDKPRLRINPDCGLCGGTGWKGVEVESTIRTGTTVRRVSECDCRRVEYDGRAYFAQAKQLPRPAIADDKELLARLNKKIPGITEAAKSMPSRLGTRSESDYTLEERDDFERKKAAAHRLAKEKFGA